MSITIGVHLNGDEVDFVYEEGGLVGGKWSALVV